MNMENQEITIIFKKNMKMSDLIDSNYNLLSLIVHLNIHLGFGEKSVEVVCKESNMDPDCFIFLANLYTNKDMVSKDLFKQLPIDPFLYYLKSSHYYFLEYRLPNIRRKLKNVFEDKNNNLQVLVLDFFDKYYNEVCEHMDYEDEVVFPYIHMLINKQRDKNYSIDMFDERHNDIEGKMIDLKHLLMKYIDSQNQHLLVNILMELYQAQDELAFHTMIEDEMVIPRVRNMELEKRK